MSDLPVPAMPVAAAPIELSYVSLAGEQILPATRENVHLLQHAADYEVCRRNLRVSGIGDIIWGVICCGLGMLLFRVNTLNAALVVLGALLIGVGIWLLAKPSPIGMIVDGAVLLLVAAWNLYVNYLAITQSRGQAFGYGPVIAIAQIVWGIYRIKSYPRFALAVAMQPSEVNMRWLRSLVRSTLKSKAKNEPDVLTLSRSGWFVRERWRARLLPEVAVFAMSTGSIGGRWDAVLAARDGVSILASKKVLMRRKYRVTLRIGRRVLKGVMPELSVQRLNAWISPVNEPAGGAMPLPAQELPGLQPNLG